MTLSSAFPVLRAADYPRAKAFWTDMMGFAVAEEGGDPPRFGIFRKEAATVFVDAWHGPDAELSNGWRAYFHTDAVDALARGIRTRGYPCDGPVNAVYGMRELTLRDPDGNLLCFGMDIA